MELDIENVLSQLDAYLCSTDSSLLLTNRLQSYPAISDYLKTNLQHLTTQQVRLRRVLPPQCAWGCTLIFTRWPYDTNIISWLRLYNRASVGAEVIIDDLVN